MGTVILVGMLAGEYVGVFRWSCSRGSYPAGYQLPGSVIQGHRTERFGVYGTMRIRQGFASGESHGASSPVSASGGGVRNVSEDDIVCIKNMLRELLSYQRMNFVQRIIYHVKAYFTKHDHS